MMFSSYRTLLLLIGVLIVQTLFRKYLNSFRKKLPDIVPYCMEGVTRFLENQFETDVCLRKRITPKIKDLQQKRHKIKTMIHKQLAASLPLDVIAYYSLPDDTLGITQKQYFSIYSELFADVRFDEFTLLQLGTATGNSIDMWHWYFPEAVIIGADVFEYSRQNSYQRAFFEKGNFLNPKFAHSLCQKNKHFGIIIDDGSHIPQHAINAFRLYFPCVQSNGIYVIEDIYKFFGDKSDASHCNEARPIDFFAELAACAAEGLSSKECSVKDVKAVHFHQDMIAVEKK